MSRLGTTPSRGSGERGEQLRDGLRLPTGQVLQRRGFNQTPYRIAPGQGRQVWVKFTEDGFEANRLASASVIVGGISYANDPIPRVVGEIPLTSTSLQ